MYIICVNHLVGCNPNIYDAKSKNLMNQRNSFHLSCSGHVILRRIFALAIILTCFFGPVYLHAQCPAGASTAVVKWDNRDYLQTTLTPYYSVYVTSAMMKSQNFSIGKNRVNIDINTGSITTAGTNATNTATAGSYGSGESVSYNGNGTIVLTFDNLVNNVTFSLYDIDALQSATVTALDGAGVPLDITMSVVTAGNVLVTGSGTSSANATALASSVGNASTQGTINISISGSSPAAANGLKSVQIVMAGTAGDFWLSDLTACVFQSFTTNYYNVSKPYTGQPSYVLGNSDNNGVSVVNPATGKARNLFQDATLTYVNNLGYDPYLHFAYYCTDGSASAAAIAANRSVKKYDYNTGTISTIIADVRTLGIPTYSQGVESGGGAFYDGSFYLGIEGAGPNAGGSGNRSGRQSAIWRIDFDASNNPVKACQVYAAPGDNGSGTMMHDWSDFGIKDGILYDFDGAAANAKFFHYDMQSGVIVNTYTPGGGLVPRQIAQSWNGTLYWLYNNIATYSAGTIGATTAITGSTALDWTGNAGDGADAFKPKVDFGDAPASYDPVSGDPAVHEIDAKLRLGSSEDIEWLSRGQTALANSDNFDDGIGAAPPLLNFNGVVSYTVTVNVFNNTGSNATVAAWLDYNFNGVYDPGEGIVATVASSASTQAIPLTWSAITVPATASLRTYLRLRVTSASNGMTKNNPTGYFSNGEVEDYPVVLGTNLPADILSFDANKKNETTAEIKWNVTGNIAELSSFEVQRSAGAQDWTTIAAVQANTTTIAIDYSYLDKQVPGGKSYYRIKMINRNGTYKYSAARSVYIAEIGKSVVIFPNPAKDQATVKFNATAQTNATISIFDNGGHLVMTRNFTAVQGNNQVNLDNLATLSNGIYMLKIKAGNTGTNVKLIIGKN